MGASRGWSLTQRYTFPSKDIKPKKTSLSVHWKNIYNREELSDAQFISGYDFSI